MSIAIDPTMVAGGSIGEEFGKNPGMNELQTKDFFKMLIMQLTQQDPFEPVKNQDLLNQISSIRTMEQSTNMSNTLQKLAEQGENTAAVNFLLNQTLEGLAMQSNMSTGASLMGKEITAWILPEDHDPDDPNLDVVQVTGIVVGVKLTDGDVTLELDTGEAVALQDVERVGLPFIPDPEVVDDDTEDDPIT